MKTEENTNIIGGIVNTMALTVFLMFFVSKCTEIDKSRNEIRKASLEGGK